MKPDCLVEKKDELCVVAIIAVISFVLPTKPDPEAPFWPFANWLIVYLLALLIVLFEGRGGLNLLVRVSRIILLETATEFVVLQDYCS